jgi:hypothetical protein
VYNNLKDNEMITETAKKTPTMEDKIKKTAEKLAKMRADKRKRDAAKATGTKAERTLANNQKYLIGAFVLEHFKKQNKPLSSLVLDSSTFDAWLVNSRDRKKFGL